jgi:hypothetical protein
MMTEVIDGSPPPRIIRDWRDWLNEFPKVAALCMLAIAGWALAGIGFVVGIIIIGIALAHGRTIVLDPSHLALIDRYKDGLVWLTPFAVAAIVGTRATEKPEVIRAEGEVKAAVVAAQTGTYPVAVTEAVPVTTAETVPPLTHRESERGE